MKTSYFAKYKDATNGVCISRVVPKYFKGEIYDIVAPSLEMINTLKETKDTVDFTRNYFEKILGPLDPFEVLNHLKGKVALCYETSDKFCHRHLLAYWIYEHTGYKVEEIGESGIAVYNVQRDIDLIPIKLTPIQFQADIFMNEQQLLIGEKLSIAYTVFNKTLHVSGILKEIKTTGTTVESLIIDTGTLKEIFINQKLQTITYQNKLFEAPGFSVKNFIATPDGPIFNGDMIKVYQLDYVPLKGFLVLYEDSFTSTVKAYIQVDDTLKLLHNKYSYIKKWEGLI